MGRLATAVAFFLLSFGCSSAPEPVDVSCLSTATCAETVCPELCGEGGEVTMANCSPSSSTVEDPGRCNCQCNYEVRRLGCFSGNSPPGHRNTVLIHTDADCAETRNCESVCEAECIWGFLPSSTECQHSGPSNELEWRCDCWCPKCEWTG